MLFLRTTKILIYFFLIVLLVVKAAFSEKPYSKDKIIQQSRTIKPYDYNRKNCFRLVSIKLEEAGFVTLHFKHNDRYTQYSKTINTHKSKCPENVLYDVRVFKWNDKPSKSVGAKGVNGRTTEKDFWIQVSQIRMK